MGSTSISSRFLDGKDLRMVFARCALSLSTSKVVSQLVNIDSRWLVSIHNPPILPPSSRCGNMLQRLFSHLI